MSDRSRPMISTHIVCIGVRGEWLYFDLSLPAIPRVGEYVLTESGRLGMKVSGVLIAPEGVTLQVREETAGDFDFAGLLKEGWRQGHVRSL